MKLLNLTLCAIAALTLAASVNAATLTVTKTGDTNDGVCDADCSLKEAVAAAASGDTVNFASPLFDSAQTIMLTSGSDIVLINKDLTISGPGANKLTVSGGGITRIFSLRRGIVTLSGMTLTGGNGAGDGGDGWGGAIEMFDTALTLDGLNITGNTAVFGGGIYLNSDFNTVIRNSTFSANTSGQYGSAICEEFSFGMVTIINTTVSGNTATTNASIYHHSSGEMIVQNSTVVNNTGGDSGGIYSDSVLRLRSSIIAGNTGIFPDLYFDQGQTSEGFNLIGDSPGDAADTNWLWLAHPTDILDTDPQLGALGYNVGSTPVHTPAAGSPVVDKGSAFGQITDQRGSPRTYDNPDIANASGGDGTDIGAVELQAALAAEVSLTGKVTNASGYPIRSAEITVQGNGIIRRTLTSQFGFYRITGLEAGVTYSITVAAKRYSFADPTQTVTATDNLTGINFVASP